MKREAEGPRSLYRSEQAKLASHRSYDRSMELWSTDYTDHWVETEYGTTHIIVSGPADGMPLILVPGLFADATMWYANAAALAGRYRVYAVDLPVFGGKSEPSSTPIADVGDYAHWFGEILDHYRIDKTAVAGLSYGSWLSLALAREVPERIATVIMLDPSETFIKMRASMFFKGFRYFVLFPSREKYRTFFDWMGGGYHDAQLDIWFEHMLDVIELGSVGMMDVPQHRIYKREELEMVTMPVLIMAGGKPIIYRSPEEFARAARAALPHAEIEIVPGAGHSLNMEKPAEVNSRMLQFLDDNYRGNTQTAQGS